MKITNWFKRVFGRKVEREKVDAVVENKAVDIQPDKPRKSHKRERVYRRPGGKRDATGHWLTRHDLMCLKIMGCDLEKAGLA